MSNEILREIMEKVDQLTTEEQLRLIGELSERARGPKVVGGEPRRKWSDLVGMLAYPACGEDAQEFISRSRREADVTHLRDLNR